jgi:hypothetical protein
MASCVQTAGVISILCGDRTLKILFSTVAPHIGKQDANQLSDDWHIKHLEYCKERIVYSAQHAEGYLIGILCVTQSFKMKISFLKQNRKMADQKVFTNL